MASGDNEINVKVTATTDGLVSGLSKATGEVKDFGSEINGLAQRMAAIKPDAFKALAQEFNNGKVDLDEFRDGLIAMSTASSAASTTLSAASTEAVALANSSHLSAGGMRELVVVGRELASGNFTRLPGSLSILATRLGGISPQAILATAGIAAVGYALYEIIDSSQQADAALEKIQNAFTAVGAGDQFDRSQIQQYVADLRQIPGVTADIANAVVNDFARVKNGTKVLGEATGDIKPLSELLGIEVPQAAHLLAEALEDPAKGIQSLQKYGVELTASQQEEIRQMMAVNDVAGAQRVLLDGLGSSISGLADTTTGFERFWTDLGNSFSGVSEKAAQTRLQLEALARTASDPSIAEAARIWAGVEGVKSRNVPGTSWSGSSGTVAGGDEKQAAQDKAAQTRKDNEEIAVTNKMYETGNSALREQEVHRQNILKINEGINAAERLGDDAAVKRGNADLETENKKFYGEPKDNSKDENRDADAQIKAAAGVANASIKTKQAQVNEEERLNQISTQEAIKQLEELAAQEHEINLRRIADMRAVAASKGDKAGVTNAGAEAAEEDQRYAQQKIELDQRAREATEQTQNAEIAGERRVADAQAETAKAAMALRVATGQQTAQQEIQAEIQSVQQRAAEEEKFYDQQIALYQKDSAAYAKTMADKLVAEQKTDAQILQLRTRLALQSDKQDTQLTQTVTRGLNQTVTGVLQGTQTMGQAFQRLGQNIILSVVTNALDKIVTSFLSNNSTIQAAQQALSNFLDISNNSNAEVSQETAQTSASSAITTYAAEGAAAAVASTAAIPLIGPELAPAAGAEIYADIMAFQVASAAGGMVVDQDQLAMVHENEMILPAHLSQGIGSMIANGQAGGGSGHTFNNTFNLAGVQGKDIPGIIDAHIQKQARNGAYGGMRRS